MAVAIFEILNSELWVVEKTEGEGRSVLYAYNSFSASQRNDKR
jgi:hypothetical protein